MSSSTAPAVPGGSGTVEENFEGNLMAPNQLMVANPAVKQEVVTHGTQNNNIDPYIYMNFLFMASLTWSTAALPGTIIFQTPIHPSKTNTVVSYLSKIYNTWGGGFQYRMKLAGTGFHAGALGWARIPPNIKPSSLTTIADFTAFEWDIIDPKQLESITISMIDQKNLMYHYRDFDENDPTTFGGYFVLFVMMPLNTSSTGSQQINLTIWSRADPSFTVAQIVPPALAITTGGPETAGLLFPKEIPWTDPLTGLAVNILRISTSNVTTSTYGVVDYAGLPLTEKYTPLSVFQSIVVFNGAGSLPEVCRWADRITELKRPLLVQNIGLKTVTAQQVNSVTSSTTGTALAFTSQASTPLNVGTGKQFTVQASTYDPSCVYNASTISGVPITPYLNESIVEFKPVYNAPNVNGGAETASTAQLIACQTVQMITALTNQAQGIMTQGTGFLYALRDKVTGLGVAYLKLNSNGVMTATRTNTQVLYDLAAYTIEPVGSIADTDPVPTNTLFAQNNLLCLMRDKKKMKPFYEAEARRERRQARMDLSAMRMNVVDESFDEPDVDEF
nr:MAG: hypothetical protein [Crogonang virus 23]